MSDSPFRIRLADADDDRFILGLAPRFVDFPLPSWRRRNECIEGIRRDLDHHLQDEPANSFVFVMEDAATGKAIGFVHLQKVQDFFNGRTNCHVSDLAISPAWDGKGAGRALLEHAEAWAREHGCHLVTLAVFPGNERARRVYAAAGYDTDLLRLAKPVR